MDNYKGTKGYYTTAIDAAKAYNQYIIDNNLPNQLNKNI